MMRRSWQLACGVLVLGLLGSGSALAQTSPSSFEWDDFAHGFTADAAGAKWFRFSAGSFVGNDAVETIQAGGGLRAYARGVSSRGTPAFTVSVTPNDPSGAPGEFDHVKWLVYMNHQASSGYPGFDALYGQELSCETWISGQTYGTDRHPFWFTGTSSNDVRLAAFAQNTIDFETGMVFDFFFTNTTVYALYERLSFARTPDHNYAAFTYAIPVAPRTSTSEQHHVKISYDRSQGVVRWILNDVEVFRVNRLGYRLQSSSNMILDHGGVQEPVEMRQLACGMGMFTLLDGTAFGGAGGLVRLSSTPAFYFMPGSGGFMPNWFWDESSQQRNRLFGQGAEIRVQSYRVSGTNL